MIWLLLLSSAFAESCQPLFSQPEVEIHYQANMLTWRGVTFAATPAEIDMVMVLTSAKIWPWDDLILKYYGHLDENMVDAKATVKQIAHNLKKRFKRVDPTFDRIQSIRNVGLYWARDEYELESQGSVSVARDFRVAFVGREKFKLTEGEHELLLKVVRNRARRGSFETIKPQSESVIVCLLNSKLKSKLIVAQDGFWKLNL